MGLVGSPQSSCQPEHATGLRTSLDLLQVARLALQESISNDAVLVVMPTDAAKLEKAFPCVDRISFYGLAYRAHPVMMTRKRRPIAEELSTLAVLAQPPVFAKTARQIELG